jgi:hypothetical protein
MTDTDTRESPARPIMTRAELAEHHVAAHGRDYSRACDGYEDMEVAEGEGWRVVANWGRDGWDLGGWPYVAIYTRERAETPELQLRGACWELLQVVEGDHDVYRFDSEADREAAMDYLFLWYAAGSDWAPLTYEQREALDAGTLDVEAKWRGPCKL